MRVYRITDLPLELIGRVCEHLDQQSLLALSLTSNQLRAAAVPTLFETASIYIWNADDVKQEVESLEAILKAINTLKTVRVLNIREGAAQNRGRQIARSYLNRWADSHYLSAGELETMSERESHIWYCGNDHPSMRMKESWAPVVQLLQQLLALKVVVWHFSREVLPGNIIDWLHSVQPRCKLETYELSLISGRLTWANSLEAIEVIPLLKTLRLKLMYSHTSERGSNSDNEAFSQLREVLRQSHHIKAAYIWWITSEDALMTSEHPSPFLTSRLPEDLTSLSQKTLVAFTTLDLRMDGSDGRDCLTYWFQNTDLSQLKTLNLEGSFSLFTMEWLLEVQFAFTSLEVFGFCTHVSHHDEEKGDATDFQFKLAAFLDKLKPLRKLRLQCFLSEHTILTIFDRHGSSLRQLWFGRHHRIDAFPSKLVDRLCATCTVLEDLEMPLMRSKGDRVEVDIYRKLGSISSLKRLHLTLEAAQPCVIRSIHGQGIYPVTTEFDKVLQGNSSFVNDQNSAMKYDSVRDCFINYAIDQSLAQTIFEIVSGHRDVPESLLEVLLLTPVATPRIFSELWTSHRAKSMLSTLGKAHVLIRDQRITHRHEIVVNEIDRHSEYFMTDSYGADVTKAQCEEIFNDIWPQDEGAFEDGRWRSNWHSFPLDIHESVTMSFPRTPERQPLKFRTLPNDFLGAV